MYLLWLQISGCSDKPKDKRPAQERAKPTFSTDPDRRNQLAGWQSARAGLRYIETHSEDTNPRFIPSFTEYPGSEDNSCTGWKSDRNDGPTIRSDGRHGRPWRLITNLLSSKDVIDMIDPDDWNPLCINVFIDRIRSNSYLRIDESVREAEFIYPTTLLAISWIREINRVAVARLKARCFINVETKRYSLFQGRRVFHGNAHLSEFIPPYFSPPNFVQAPNALTIVSELFTPRLLPFSPLEERRILRGASRGVKRAVSSFVDIIHGHDTRS